MLRGQRSQQRPGQVDLRPQHPLASAVTLADVGRIRPEELRRGRAQRAVDDGPAMRDVVSLVPPGPGAGRRRLAEDHEEVELGVADVPSLALVEDLLELPDPLGLVVPLRAEARLHQRQGGRLLGVGHRLERHALAFARDEVPVEAVLAVEREHRRGALLRGQRLEKRVRRFGHPGGLLGVVGHARGAGGHDGESCEDDGNEACGHLHGILLGACVRRAYNRPRGASRPVTGGAGPAGEASGPATRAPGLAAGTGDGGAKNGHAGAASARGPPGRPPEPRRAPHGM